MIKNETLEFFLAMIPPRTTAQQNRIIGRKGKRPIFYKDDKLSDAHAKLTAYLGQHVPQVPFHGPIRLEVKWCWSGKQKKTGWKITRPDTDNLQKMLKDIMTKLAYWNDDALVCSEQVEKIWNEIPGIYIRIEDLS